MLKLLCYLCLMQLCMSAISSTNTTNDDFRGDEIIDELTTLSSNDDFVIDENDDTTTTVTDEFGHDLRILNKDFDRLGKIYVSQYYSLFDDPKNRLSLVALYHPDDSFMTFEGERYRGTSKILSKFQKLNLKNLVRKITSIDIQPLLDGGLIINVIGNVHENDKPDQLYAQTFIYKPQKGSFFLQHDIFRVIRP